VKGTKFYPGQQVFVVVKIMGPQGLVDSVIIEQKEVAAIVMKPEGGTVYLVAVGDYPIMKVTTPFLSFEPEYVFSLGSIDAAIQKAERILAEAPKILTPVQPKLLVPEN
jgi:hypothetical protein